MYATTRNIITTPHGTDIERMGKIELGQIVGQYYITHLLGFGHDTDSPYFEMYWACDFACRKRVSNAA